MMVFNNIVSEINKVLPRIKQVASPPTHTMTMKENILSNINEIAVISRDMSFSTEEVVASVDQQGATMNDLLSLPAEIKRASDSMIREI